MKNRFTIIILGVLFIAVISYVLGVGFFKKQTTTVPKTDKIEVATSFYPLYYFASEIGKDKVNVINLTPAGAEPHDYEPSTQDIAKLETGKLLIANGAGFEPWLDKVSEDLKSKNIRVISVAEGLAAQEVEEDGKIIRDPHTWLDPVLVKQEVQKISKALIEVDPNNQSFYEVNVKNLETKLDSLDQSFKQGLANCKQKNIVTSHAAFGYVASRYGLKQVAITGLSPDQEPSPQELGEIAKFAKDNGVKYIFFETLVSPRLAETIAKEIGAQTLVFDPIEGLTPEDQQAGSNYFSVQEDNLKNLRIALECK